MRIFFYIIACILMAAWSSLTALSAPIVVAVVDTGYSKPQTPYSGQKPVFCKMGHVDFTKPNHKVRELPRDNLGHGTNIVHIIANTIGKVPNKSYCIVVIKYFDMQISGSKETLNNSIKALRWAKTLKASIVNLSYEGNLYSKIEEKSIQDLLDSGAKIIAAAGNRGTYPGYPASADSRVIVVGNLQKNGLRHPTSNYGPSVDRWEVGTNMCAGNICMTGTSQATAVATGKIIKQMINERKSK